MPDTTTNYGWSFGVLTDSPIDLLDIGTLAPAIDAQMAGTTTIGVPGTATVSLGPSAWTELCSVSITLPTPQPVEVTGWAFLVNQGTGRPVLALQILDGSTHLGGIGGTQVAGTNDNYSLQETFIVPRRKFGLTAGSHTLHLQAWKDGSGAVDAWKTRTLSAQDIAVTGIEATY